MTTSKVIVPHVKARSVLKASMTDTPCVHVCWENTVSDITDFNWVTLYVAVFFLSLQGPGGWNDVLTPRKLQGQCHKDGCNGTFAVSWDSSRTKYPNCMHDDIRSW